MADVIDPRKYSAFVLIHPLEGYAGAPRDAENLMLGIPRDLLAGHGLGITVAPSIEDVRKVVPDRIEFLQIFKKAIIGAWTETAHKFAAQGKQVILFIPKGASPHLLPKALTKTKGVEIVYHSPLPKNAKMFKDQSSEAEAETYFTEIAQQLAEKIKDPSNVLLGGLYINKCYLAIARHLVNDTNVQKVTIRTDLTDRLKAEVAGRTQTNEWIIAQSRRLGELYGWFVYDAKRDLLGKISQFEWTADKATWERADDYILTLRGHGAEGIETPFARYIRPRRRARKIPVLRDIPAQLVYEWQPRKTRR